MEKDREKDSLKGVSNNRRRNKTPRISMMDSFSNGIDTMIRSSGDGGLVLLLLEDVITTDDDDDDDDGLVKTLHTILL